MAIRVLPALSDVLEPIAVSNYSQVSIDYGSSPRRRWLIASRRAEPNITYIGFKKRLAVIVTG